jgi:hypothetical protein
VSKTKPASKRSLERRPTGLAAKPSPVEPERKAERGNQSSDVQAIKRNSVQRLVDPERPAPLHFVVAVEFEMGEQFLPSKTTHAVSDQFLYQRLGP